MSEIENAVPLRYKDEDTRPTSKKELAGWYAYAFAAETYVICGSFIPILLESLARAKGVLLSDKSVPCGDSSSHKNGQCIVYVMGLEVNTASFAMYTFSGSVLLQALLVVSISCAADHGNYRKTLLLFFAWIGSLSVTAYIFVTEQFFLLGAALAVISNASFGASFVLLNSFLPLLVRYHPEVRRQEASTLSTSVNPQHGPAMLHDETSGAVAQQPFPNSFNSAGYEGDHNEGQALLGNHSSVVAANKATTSVELRLSSQISSKGMGTGYLAALFLQCVAIAIVVAMGSTTWSLRVVLCMVGTWWTIFTVPAALWLRPRPGPPMPAQLGWYSYLTYSWRELFRTLRQARRLIDIVFFLAAWFLLSDAIATTSSTAILFAKTQLHMKPWSLGMINVTSTMSGVVGAFSWAYIAKYLKLSATHTVLACISLFGIIPIYGLLGYVPVIARWGVLGLQQPWEMYPLAAVYGFVLGGISSYCRSLYGELIPPGSEAAFYALYAITDKGSSIFGPAIVGFIIDTTGSIRPAFLFLAVIIGLPFPLLWCVDTERGRREGKKLAQVIEGSKMRRRQLDTPEQRDLGLDEDSATGDMGN